MEKKLFVILICIILGFSTACSKSNSSKENDNNKNQSEVVVSEEKPVTKPEDKPVIKPEAKPVTKPVIKPEAKPVTKPVTKPEAKPVEKPATKPEEKPITKPEEKPEDNILNGELKSIIEKIYTISEVKIPRTAFTEVTSENSKYYIGTDNVVYDEALASEPLIGSFAHSVVLLRVKEGSDIKKIMEEIKNNVDPRKWICVGVEPENVIVDNIDNLIILIINNESDKLHKAFLSLAK